MELDNQSIMKLAKKIRKVAFSCLPLVEIELGPRRDCRSYTGMLCTTVKDILSIDH